MNMSSIKKERMLNSIQYSTLKDDPSKSKLMHYFYDIKNILECCTNDEEIPLLQDACNSLNSEGTFDMFLRNTSLETLRNWFVNLIAQCQMYVARRGTVKYLEQSEEMDSRSHILRCIMIPIVIVLIVAAFILTILGQVKILDETISNQISTWIGAFDFILAGIFFVCEQISDSKKKRIYAEAKLSEGKQKYFNIEILHIDDHSNHDDHSITIRQGNNYRGVQIGVNKGTTPQDQGH